jgi:hypothetical protein
VSDLSTIARTPATSRLGAPPRRWLIAALVLLLVLVLLPAAFYGWFEFRSRVTADRHALDTGYANALKHAEAASALYSMLRLIGAGDRASERVVARLGIMNEYVEMYVKRGRKDTTLEMMRDLHSNMVGIAVARWRDGATAPDRRSRADQLVALARAGVLLRSADGIGLPPEETQRARQDADLDWAISWFEQNKATIEKRAMQALQDTRT